ncbi:DUF427 domain-containing protein [Vreelandella titanicae]|uniref:DUF427 domain-containing protein n=1 Tax=Vreelandella titanicae TaxID=664683 RepID=UPI0039BEFABB
MLTAFTQPRTTTRHVRVIIGGSVLTVTTEFLELDYPLQQYIPRDDLRMDLMAAFVSETHCPFKDDAFNLSFDQHTEMA